MTNNNENSPKKLFETRRAPGFLFDALSKAYNSHTNRRVKPLGITVSQWPVLDQIFLNEGINQKELAKICLRDPSTLVNSLDGLEKKGFIRREPDKNDRRAFNLYITEDGITVRNAVFKATNDLFENATKHLTQQEIDQLYTTCISVYNALQEIDD